MIFTKSLHSLIKRYANGGKVTEWQRELIARMFPCEYALIEIKKTQEMMQVPISERSTHPKYGDVFRKMGYSA